MQKKLQSLVSPPETVASISTGELAIQSRTFLKAPSIEALQLVLG